MLWLLAVLLAACQWIEEPDAPAIGLPVELFECAGADPQPQTARLVSVTDGDTITVEMDGQRYRVRYIGINAPEFDSDEQDLAQLATDLNRQLVEGQTLTLYRDTSETDRFDRLLRYVFAGDVFINHELVLRGVARARDYPPDSACKDTLQEVELEARRNQVGIWRE